MCGGDFLHPGGPLGNSQQERSLQAKAFCKKRTVFNYCFMVHAAFNVLGHQYNTIKMIM